MAIVLKGKNIVSSSTQRRKHYCCFIRNLKAYFNVIFLQSCDPKIITITRKNNTLPNKPSFLLMYQSNKK